MAHLTFATWRHPWQFSLPDVPAGLRPWLQAQDSMTRRLRRFCHDVHIRVRLQDWAQATPSEAQLLGHSLRQRTLIREAEIIGNGQIQWLGRSIFPYTSLAGAGRVLQGHLDNRSLGDFLFGQGRAIRGPLQWSQLNPSDFEYDTTMTDQSSSTTPLWARRSLFWYAKKPLLVTEILSPRLLALTQGRSE